MSRVFAAAVALAMTSAATAAAQAAAPASAPAAGKAAESVCKYVVSSKRGSKPFQLCMTKSQWAEKERKDAKDANRIECHYEEVPGTKIRGRKICQSASEWAEQRRVYREQVEQIQMKTCVPGAGC